ncbi:hypothetical protein E3J61_02285 [Candidatus Dependentiae bacterium]|nr:MAG: hypothetical protein E3J61_02285 [Candidatus Dependentiae bacterium]
MEEPSKEKNERSIEVFSGHIYIFHAFDVGDDINLEKVAQMRAINTIPLSLPKYFKNYHAPLAIELPHPNESARCVSCKIHNFGAISLTYKIPFTDSFANLREQFYEINNQYQEQSVADVKLVFKKIETFITQPKFFQMRSSYNIIQVHPEPKRIALAQLQKKFGALITSTMRLETETLSEYQKNEMLGSAIGYYRGNMVIVDTDTTFIYDDEYQDILEFVEFANLQQLELHYFDRLLDQKLNAIYESGGSQRVPLFAYFPFVDTKSNDPVAILGKLKVDISVITERLEGSIKVAGDPYYTEIHDQLNQKLDLKSWQQSIERKLDIVKDVLLVYQHKTDVIRENVLEVLIVILIFIELIIGILHYIKA